MATDVVRSLLRPSESLRCLLSVEHTATRLSPSPPSHRPDPTGTPLRRRLIAVVTRRVSPHDVELGSLLILDTSPSNGVVGVADALPITGHLALAVAQTGPVESHTEEHDPGIPTEAWSGWLLTIRRSAQDTKPLEFNVRTRNTPDLQSLTTECRRLREIAIVTRPTSSDFSWVEAYFLDPSPSRPDLRVRNQPLHTRLSTAIAGLPGDDTLDISIVRREWIEQKAAKDASDGQVKHLNIRLGTFNVNGKAPSQDLYPWLRSSESESKEKPGRISPLNLSPFEIASNPFHRRSHKDGSLVGPTNLQAFEDPDMLVLGFQELDRSTEALLYATTTLKEDEWLTAIFAGLGEKRVLYEKLTSRQLVGMLLIVIVKKSIAPCFGDIQSCEAGSGIMGFMGNKGATAVRLKFTPSISSDLGKRSYRSTVLTFVNAHLAASDEMAERRNYDFQELSGRLAFTPSGLNENYPPSSIAEDTHNIYQSDVLFWMGDLNYRLDLADGDIRKLLFSHASGIDSIQILLLYDQLRAAIRNNKAFSGFREHSITHNPTYRLNPGVSKDELRYDIKRKPAWTDRVLYMAPPDVSVTQVAYRSHPEITMSDHQPVSADFDISWALVDQSQYEKLVSTLYRELAGFEESEGRPKIKIWPTSIELGTIKYKQAVRREVALRNEGNIPCVFRFVGTHSHSGPISPPWLRIEPMAGLLRPGETTTVLLSAYIDNYSATKLNLGPSLLEYTLILHTALGKDDFLTVSGHYQYTCFSNTLSRLTRLAGPIRKLESPEELVPEEQAINAPREIMRLINWMMAHVSTTDALFEHPAQEELCDVIRECLDTGDEFPCSGPDGDHSSLVGAFASTLVLLLDSLIEPVVPARWHARCLQARDKDEAFEVLNVFPHESINVWISLTAFLHYVTQHNGSMKEANSRSMHRLASIFALVLLRDDPSGIYPRVSPVGKRDFLLLFIE